MWLRDIFAMLKLACCPVEKMIICGFLAFFTCASGTAVSGELPCQERSPQFDVNFVLEI